MALETGVIPQELQGVYSQDPYLPLPEPIQPSMLDLIGTGGGMSTNYAPTTPSRNAMQSFFDDFSRTPASMTTLSTPVYFDYDAAQVDRYKSSDMFNALGFDPSGQVNNEFRYGARQTWGDIWSNGLNGMFRLAGNTYIEGWKGWGNLIDAIGSTSWDEAKQDLIGTPEYLLEQDKITKDIMNKYAIYSTPESEEGIFNRQFFGNMLQQSGFAVGAIGQFLSEELLTWGLSTQFSVAKLGLRLPAIFGKVVTKADIAKDLTSLGSPIWKSRSVAEGLVQGARKFVPFADTVYDLNRYGKAGAGLGQMAAIGVGGVRRVLSESNMALTEARMEAAGTYAELYNKLYDEELRRTGQAPSFEVEERIKASAMAGAQDNLGVNYGILMLSNRLQFDNIFSKFGTSRAIFGTTGEFANDVLKVTGKRVGAETAEETTKLYAKGKLGTLGLLGQVSKDFGGKAAAWQATKSLGKNVFKWEASEGLQELFQEGSNIALQDYYYDLYHGYKGTSMDKSIDKAIESQANIQGLKTFLMGALTGRMLSPINFTVGKVKEFAGTTSDQRAARYKNINEAVKEVNAFYENPNKFLGEHIANIKVQNKVATNMQEAVANRDQYVFNNNKNSGFAKMISSAIKTDMTGAVLDTLRGYGETFNEEDFKEAFGLDMTTENIKSTKEFFNNIANEVETFHKNWKALKDKYGDSVLLDMYEEGTPERRTALIAKRALDDAIEIMATNDYKAHKAAQRAVQLQTEMASVPQIGASVGSAFRNLGVLQNTQKEIDILRAEVENLTAQPKKDAASRELLKSKKEQLESLENWKEQYENLKTMEPGQKRKFNKAAKVFERYVNAKNRESGIDTTIKADDVQEIYKNLTEYIDLNNDVKDYVDAYNIMANPIQFVKVHQRLMESIDATGKKLLEEHIKEVENILAGKPPVEKKDPLAPGEVIEDKPNGLPDNAKVLDSKNGIYLIEESDDASEKFYYIVNKDGDPVVDVKLDDKMFPGWEPSNLYTIEDARIYFDALVEVNADKYKEYQFDGQTLKYGDILVDSKGRKYRVTTQKQPTNVQGKLKIFIVPLEGSIRTEGIQNLNGFKLEKAFESALLPENPDAFRLKRVNEVNRIYPKVNKDQGETPEQAKERLKQFIHSTSKEDFLSGVTIKVTRNTQLGQTSLAGTEGIDQNKHLQMNPEPYMVEIMYAGETIGFATYYNRYTYLDNAGKPIALNNITKEQFVQIFDSSKKDVTDELKRFKENYNSGQAFFTAVTNKLPEGSNEVVLTNDEVNTLFNVAPSAGEYDFATDRDIRVSFDELDYSTINDFTYIIDQRTRYLGNGMYEEDTRVHTDTIGDTTELEKRINDARYEGGEDKIRNYGRYVGVVELPNGSIKFIELQSSPVASEQLDALVEKINNKSKELKENNTEEKTDAKTKKKYLGAINPIAANNINTEINDSIYITVAGKRGYTVSLEVKPTGDIKVEFSTYIKGSTNKDKQSITIQESADASKPLQLKNSTDLIERINRAIDDHNQTNFKKINVKLDKNSFKNSIADNAEVKEYRQLISGVNKPVVKNEGIYVYAKKNQQSHSSNVLNPVIKSKQVAEEPSESALEGVVVPPKIAAAQAEFLAQRKAEQQKLSIQDKLQELNDKKDALINEIEGELLKSGMKRVDVMKHNYNADPRIQAINQEIAQINNSAALKISNKLTAQDSVNINTFRKWVQQHLPAFISVEELKNMARRMKTEGMTVGMFYTHMNELNNQLEGKIAVGKNTPFKYHEAFHAIFRMLLTDQQIDKYLSIAKQELRQQGKSIAKLKQELLASKPEFYSKLTEEQLEERVYEEYLADKFDAWKSDIKTPTSSENKSFFRWLIDFVKNFFKSLKSSPLEDLFQSIEKGDYKNSSLVKNRFTAGPNIAVSQTALKAIQIGFTVIDNEDGERERIPIYLSQQEGDVLASTIAAVYHRRMSEAGLSTHNEDVMDGVLADYANLYDRRINPYYESDEFYERYDSALAANKAIEKLDQKYKIFSNKELLETLKSSIREHTRIMGYQMQSESDAFDDNVDSYGDRVTTDNHKETYSIGGYGSLSEELRQYLATIVEETADEFGNTRFVSEEGSPTEEALIEAVNANVLYNGILKAVAGSTDQFQMLDRLRIFAEHNPEARKFWSKFSNDVDLQYDENGNFVDIGNKNQANLFQAVIKGFNQYSVDYYFINKDISKRDSRISEANRKGAARNQFSIWYNAFIRLYRDQYDNTPRDIDSLTKFINTKTAPLNRLATILKKGNTYKADIVNTEIDSIVLLLKNELGISLSPLFVKYSYLSTVDTKDLTDDELRILKAFEGTDVMTEEDAREIASILKSGKDPFGSNIDPDKIAESEQQVSALIDAEKSTPISEEEFEEQDQDVEDDIDSAVGRLTRIAAGNSVFDEQVSSTSYKNAEGELVYSHQLPTFNLVRAAELQSENFRNTLKKDKFLATNHLLNSPFFNHIADTLKIARIDGIKSSSLTKNEDGSLTEDKRLNVNQNDGITFGSMTDREFLISLFELYANNKKHVIPPTEGEPRREFMTSSVLLGVIEASNTGDMLNLPVIRSVEYKKGNIVLTKDAQDILLNEVKREFDRISRVNFEIESGTYPKGIIDGYHNGQMRGLKFIKMGNMLGNLVTTLEEAAKNNEDISQYNDQILSAINNYWLGDGGQVDQIITLLKDQGIFGVTKEDKLSNKLLNNFIFDGFKSNGKTDKDRNAMLNMVVSAPEHNIGQILLNNFINTLSARQLFIGDAAENYKDDGGVDEVKRNKGLNGSGASISSIITAPNLGINHANRKSHVVTIVDPQYKGAFSGKNKEKADAQMWMSVKALRYTLFGLGKLNQAQAELLDNIEKGKDVTVKDIFGELYEDENGIKRTKGGSISYNAQTNSIKLVYNDGKKYIKTSGIVLTKQLTSLRDGNGGWMARPGYEELHTLREKLEAYESVNETITFAIPKSASKGYKSNIAADVNSISDENFVEHDNNFWRLQLENPSNKLLITDPTQAKMLIIAEQSRDLVVNFQGEEMTLGDVIDNYLKDTEQRVKNNYFSARDEMFDIEGAFKELKKSITQSQITPKLGKFLSRQVETLKSTGADPQLIEFFTPIKNEQTGEYTPKYDLNHPITLDKFTQLFLAYFSKGVMSEKSPGHSLALASNYGMKVVKRVTRLDENGQPLSWEVITRRQYEKDRSLLSQIKSAKRYDNDMDRQFADLRVGDIYIDDLRHNVPEFDEQGNITGYFTEYMMPPHFREDMNIYNEDGTISEAALKAFAVRIPSQDKHSFATTKLVDFLPAFYGSTAVFPHELIEISGADFDIDKVYMHIMDFYRKDGERIPYGTAKTKEDKFTEYVMYLQSKNKAFKTKIASLRKEIKEEEVQVEEGGVYNSFEDLAKDLFTRSLDSMMIESALKELGLPSNADEYAKAVKEYGELNNGVLNNRILEAKIKLQNNEEVVKSKNGALPIAFQVAEVQPLLDLIETFKEKFPILRDIFVETGSDVDSIIGQYKAFKNNKEGARNIGPAVNSMLVYALMNSYGIQTRIRENNSTGEELFVLTIDGHKFNSYEHNRSFQKRTEVTSGGAVIEDEGYTGDRIFYHISAIVSAMTDNAKERLAARLGLNINAVGVVSNMVALGVPLETAVMFNLQPSVREFYKRINTASKKIKTKEEENLKKSKVADELLQELADKMSKDDNTQEITTELLENNIKSAGSNAAVDYSIFNSFIQFYNQTEFYSSVAQVIKLSKGLGTSNEDIDKIEEKEKMLGLSLSDADFAKSNIPFDLRQVLTGKDSSKPHHNITANYIRIKNQLKELQKSIFTEKTYLFQRLKETILKNLNVTSKEKESFETTLKRDIIAYLGIKSYMQYLKVNGKAAKLAGLDNAMIYDSEAVARGEGFMDIIDTVRSIREQLPNNYFATKFLNMVPVKLFDANTNQEYFNDKSRGGINTVESNTWAKLGEYEQNRIGDSFIEIYSNPKTRNLAYNLFNYLIVKDGGQFKSGSFIKFIPPAMFKELLDATGAAHQLLKRDSLINDTKQYMETFGATAVELFNEFTSLYTTNINNAFNIKSVTTYKKASEEAEKKRPKNYVPEVIMQSQDESTLVIDLFGGVRKPQMTLLIDEYGNEFYDEVTNTGKFSEEELNKLGYNKEVLKANGFKLGNRPDEKGNNRYFLELPFTIKIVNKSVTGDIKNTIFYKLKSTGRKVKLDAVFSRTSAIISRGDVRSNRNILYVFGDNDAREGLAGQAKQMRGEPNAMGISTKKSPNMGDAAFKNDAEFEENARIITQDVDAIIAAWNSGSYTKVIVPPIGQGLAKLSEKAPKTWAYLNEELRRLEKTISAAAPTQGVGTFIKEIGDTITLSNTAIYEKFEPTGSKKQWKVGGLTGEMPTNLVLRNRRAKNSSKFDPSNDIFDRAAAELDNILGNVNPLSISTEARDLFRDWGITFQFVGNKIVFYKGKEVYKTEITEPAELLRVLNENPVEREVSPKAMQNTFVEPEEKDDLNISNLAVGEASLEESRNKMKDMIEARRKEIEERKKQDDAGCEG
jgi:hypothetical protein